MLDGDIDGQFEPFLQGPIANNNTVVRGSGLGMTISKHLIEFLGGNISYRPNPAGGSIFEFNLQFNVAKQVMPLQLKATQQSILVVEDDPVNCFKVVIPDC